MKTLLNILIKDVKQDPLICNLSVIHKRLLLGWISWLDNNQRQTDKDINTIILMVGLCNNIYVKNTYLVATLFTWILIIRQDNWYLAGFAMYSTTYILHKLNRHIFEQSWWDYYNAGTLCWEHYNNLVGHTLILTIIQPDSGIRYITTNYCSTDNERVNIF